METCDYALGIDIGTTNVKVTLIDIDTLDVKEAVTKETKANIESGLQKSEQCTRKIFQQLQACLAEMTPENLAQVKQISITGQMHGLVLWKRDMVWEYTINKNYRVKGSVTNLITWQDSRCDAEFLATLPNCDSHLRIASGYGCSSLFWLQRNRPTWLKRFNQAGTIQDLIVLIICGLSEPKMTTHNAASWGYFNTKNNTWNKNILKAVGFPVHLLPIVVNPGCTAGKLQHDWFSIPAGVRVTAALGDMQCSFLSCNRGRSNTAVLNIGTSAQFAYEVSISRKTAEDGAIEHFPYFCGTYLAVAASLNGGCVLSSFVNMLHEWISELGVHIPEDRIWDYVLKKASSELSTHGLRVIPTLRGERHAPHLKASVSGIGPENLQMGTIFFSLCVGIIKNLIDLMPVQQLMKADIDSVMACGSLISKNSLFVQEIRKQLPFPVLVGCEGDAAYGAVLAGLTDWKNLH
ncbi:Sedoheptulokinase [Nymphon striatum]|nr:Sedoheptulokinase [Nymphon striatum]